MAGTNILVNDGGAPARIMKLGNADADIDAGTFVGMSGAAVSAAILPNLPDVGAASGGYALGVLFVDAVDGEPASVITGSGLQVMLKSTGTVAAGDKLGHDASGVALRTTTTDHRVMAIALAAKDSNGFTKAVLL